MIGGEALPERDLRDGALVGSPSQRLLGLARAWYRRGQVERSLGYLRRAIELDENLQGAHVELARVLLEQGRWRDALAASEAGLVRFPQRELLHKSLIRSLTEAEGHTAVLERYGLERRDARPIATTREEVLCCLVVRDEVERLPWFLTANRRLGVSRFLVVDNGSGDGSLEFLQAQPDVHVWSTSMSFRQALFGAAWFEALLSRHGLDRWVLILDADEVFRFPDDDRLSVRELCVELDRHGRRAMSGLLLDMYGPGPVAETRYVPGEDFLDHCRFFDRRTHHRESANAGVFANQTSYVGGARARAFGADTHFLQTKTPLVRYDADVVLAGGQHWTSHPAERIAHDGCAVLHFKFFSSLAAAAEIQVSRDEHADDSIQYRVYAATLERDPAICLYDPDESVAFTSPRQLVELGVIDERWRDGHEAGNEVPSPPSLPGPTCAERWLLRFVLDGDVADWRRWAAASDLDEHGRIEFVLFPAVYRRLEKATEPHPWLGRLKGVYRRQWTRNALCLASYTKACRVLESAAIPWLLPSDRQAADLLPDPTVHALQEPRITVPWASIGRAIERFARAGWRVLPAGQDRSGVRGRLACSAWKVDDGSGGGAVLTEQYHPSRAGAAENARLWSAAVPGDRHGEFRAGPTDLFHAVASAGLHDPDAIGWALVLEAAARRCEPAETRRWLAASNPDTLSRIGHRIALLSEISANHATSRNLMPEACATHPPSPTPATSVTGRTAWRLARLRSLVAKYGGVAGTISYLRLMARQAR